MTPDYNRVIDFRRTVESRTRGFTGREWLWGVVNDWLAAPGPRYFLLTGEPGCGKTAAAARLVQFSEGAAAPPPRLDRLAPGFLSAVHFCSDETDPVVFSRSVALQLARIPAYARVLKDVGERVAEIEVTYHVTGDAAGATLQGVVINNLIVSGLGGRAAFSRLVVDPLRIIYQDEYADAVTLLIDSLDDSRRFEGMAIADLIVELQSLDPRVRVLATSQPDLRLTASLITPDGDPAAAVVDLGAEATARADTAEFLRRRLSEPGLRPDLDRAPLTRPLDEVVSDLAAAAEGNFLIAKLFADAIEKDAQDGAYELLTLPREHVPRTLDAFYRRFLATRIQSGVNPDVWVDRYAPVLGVLAVAGAPLTVSQTAAFAGVPLAVADAVVRAVEPFLEVFVTPGGPGRALYHRTFADFLLTADESRNPSRLDARVCHDRIAAACLGPADPYALAHLPFHLREAGRVAELCELLAGPFARRQSDALGSEHTAAELGLAARAAARAGRDELFLSAQETGLRLRREAADEWETGRYVLALLGDPPPLIRARGLQCAGDLLPWPAFLAAERLLDLGAAAAAEEVLRAAAGRAWPSYRYPIYSTYNIGEGSVLDFVLETGAGEFLARVALVAPSAALELTLRLYPDGARTPNVRTAWREVLRVIDERAGPSEEPATATQCLRVAEVTCEWLTVPGYALGWAGMIRILFRLLARAVPVADPRWLEAAIAVLIARRLQARGVTHSNQDASGDLEALADIADGLLLLRDALPDDPGHPTAAVRKAVVGGLSAVDEKCPAAVVPTEPSYYRRSTMMARVASCLHRMGSAKWRDYAIAAITACELDAATDDPPLGAVAEALVSLRTLPDPGAATRVDALSRSPRLAELVAEAAQTAPAHGPVEPGPNLAEQLAGEPDLYDRGRLALAAWRRSGPGVRAAVEAGLAAARDRRSARPRRSDELPPPEFSEAVAEALVAAANQYPGEGVHAAIERLEASRTEDRRDALSLDPASLRHVRWVALIRRKASRRLRAEVEPEWDAVRKADDRKAQLQCCNAAVWFDPATAERWYREVRDGLTRPGDRGLAAALFVAERNAAAPIPAADAARWAAELPEPEAGVVAPYQLRVCSLWGGSDALRGVVAGQLRHIAANLVEAVTAVRAQPVGKRRADPAWPWLGRVLGSVAGITGPPGDERVAVVGAVADAVVRVWRSAAESARRGAADPILTAFADATTGALPRGPVSALVVELFRALGPDAGREESVSDRTGRLELGVRLATRYKAAEPDWSDGVAREAECHWESLLEREPAASSAPEGMADLVAQVLGSRLPGVRGRREEMVLVLTRRLADWCTADPFSPDRLSEMQARLARVADPDVRTPSLAPVAIGWLRLGEVDRASRLREVVGPPALEAADFTASLLAAATADPIPADRLAALKGLSLNVIVSTPLAEAPGVFTDSLAAWFALRFAEVAGRGDDYLRRMTEWILGAAARRV
jgi:hypothetical protein